MYFRLGADENNIRRGLTGISFLQARGCGKAIGVSLDEPLPGKKYIKNRKVYIFNPRSWTADDFKL